MKKTEGFIFNGSRYKFDFGMCSCKKGWAQIDTAQDAHYFGMWCNPATLKVFSYVEGDTYLTECKNVKEFKDELLKIKNFYKEDYQGIDCPQKEQQALFIKYGYPEYREAKQ